MKHPFLGVRVCSGASALARGCVFLALLYFAVACGDEKGGAQGGDASTHDEPTDDTGESGSEASDSNSEGSTTEPTASEGTTESEVDTAPTDSTTVMDETSSTTTGSGGATNDDAGTAGSAGASGSGTVSEAEGLVTRLLGELDLGQATESWVANVTRQALEPSQVIAPAVGSSSFTPSQPYDFMFLDLVPRGRFQHPTQFIFAEGDQDLVIEQQGWWPELDGVGFVVTNVPVIKLFSPELGAVTSALPYPAAANDDHRREAQHAPVFALYPDLDADSGEARLFFYADATVAAATPAYVNVLADLDGDGEWSLDSGERLVTNFALPSASEGFTPTPPFALPVDANNKFTLGAWLRVAVTRDPVPELELDASAFCNEGIVLECTDESYDFSAYTGSSCTSEYEGSGCSLSITWGPAIENPPVPDIEGIESSYICQPEGLVIPTVTKALVINTGDTPGRNDSEYEMNKAAAIFALHYGDEAVAKLNTPTAERALEAIGELVSELQCLDEAHIYITGHGAEGTGEIWMLNESGGITPAELHAAITSAPHCPGDMDYATSEGCRMAGYCNLSLYFTSCFSGKFLEGENSLALPGLNVLTASSGTSPAYASISGFETGEQVGHSFVQGFVNNAADAPPSGNGDGITDPAEAQRYAKDNYAKLPASDPQLHQDADCSCSCAAEPCGNGLLDAGEACDSSAGIECSATLSTCNPTTCECDCELTVEDCAPNPFDPETCECIIPPCGNGTLEGDEDCDDSVLGGQCLSPFESCNPTTCECDCELTVEDCAPNPVDLETCECIVPPCGNGTLDSGEACDPALLPSSCDLNFSCSDSCECECGLLPGNCDPGQEVDLASCSCVPIIHCPPTGAFSLIGQFTVELDAFGHSCCHNVPIGVDRELTFTNTNGSSFNGPGLPGQDVPPMSGTLINDSITGCSMVGAGSGLFADNYPNTPCQLINGVILNDVFTGQMRCTPIPGQPITFNFDGTLSVP